MTSTIILNYDDPENEFYACQCGIASKIAEELKYRATDHDGNETVISKLECMEFEFWNEANSFEFWSDCVKVDVDASTDILKDDLIAVLKSIGPVMVKPDEIELVQSIRA